MKPLTVRSARERLTPRMTQRMLAQLSGVDQTTISSLETGRHTNPTIDTVDRLAKALGIPPSELRFSEPQPNASLDQLSDSVGRAVAKAS
jgi:transcriptional regulator with XRE-family HTH domain